MSEFKRCDLCNRAFKSPPRCAVGTCPTKAPAPSVPNPYRDKNERSAA